MNAVLLTGLLASLTLLSFSPPPHVRLSELSSIEDGMEILTQGTVAHITTFNTGTERLLILDGAHQLVVVCLKSEADPPSTRLLPGDLVEAQGSVSKSGEQTTLFSTFSKVCLLLRSANHLTVGALCESWKLFEGARLNVTGELTADDTGRLYLEDIDGPCRILVLSGPLSGQSYLTHVLVDCTLVHDETTLTTGIRIWGVQRIA